MNYYDDSDSSDGQSDSELSAEDILSSIFGENNTDNGNSDLTFHDIEIISDAIGAYYDCNHNSNHHNLAYAIILSLIDPVVRDSMNLSGPNILGDSLVHKQEYATVDVIPSSPINGLSYTFADSIGYYHNLIISEILENDPYGDTLFTKSFVDIVQIVDQKIEQHFNLPANYFHSNGWDSEQLEMAYKMSYVLHNYTGVTSFVNLIKQQFPFILTHADLLTSLSMENKTYLMLNQSLAALNSHPITNGDQLKKAIIVEFASDRLWK